MARIHQIKLNTLGSGASLYTKRTCTDNSDIYINSKLKQLTDLTMTNVNLHTSKRNLRKLIEKRNLDETV